MKPNIDEIEARANAATPGPWEQRMNYAIGKKLDVEPSVAFCQLENDADFVAQARTDIPALLAYIRELEAGRNGLVDLHDIPDDVRRKIMETIDRIKNEGSGGLISILL